MDDNTASTSGNKQFYSLNTKNLLKSASVIKSKSLSTIKSAYNLLSKNFLPNINSLESKADETDSKIPHLKRKFSQLHSDKSYGDEVCLLERPPSALTLKYTSSSYSPLVRKSENAEGNQTPLCEDFYQEMPVPSNEDSNIVQDHDNNNSKNIHACDKSESFPNETCNAKCLPNTLVLKDPFAPHVSLVREIVELQKESGKSQILIEDDFTVDMTVAFNIDCKTENNDLNLKEKKDCESDATKINSLSNCDSSDESESSFKTATSDMESIKCSTSKTYPCYPSLFENKNLKEPQSSGIFSKYYNYFNSYKNRIPPKSVKKRKLDSLLESLLNSEKEIPEKKSSPNAKNTTLKRKRISCSGSVLYSSDEDRPFKRRKYKHEPESNCSKLDFNHSEEGMSKATEINPPNNVKNELLSGKSFEMSHVSYKEANNFSKKDSLYKESITQNLITEIPSMVELNLNSPSECPLVNNLNQNFNNIFHFNDKREQQTVIFQNDIKKITKNKTVSTEMENSSTFPSENNQFNNFEILLNDEISTSQNVKSSWNIATTTKNSELRYQKESILLSNCIPNAKESSGFRLRPEMPNQENEKDMNNKLPTEFQDNCLENENCPPFPFEGNELSAVDDYISYKNESSGRYSIFNENDITVTKNIISKIIPHETDLEKKSGKSCSTNFNSDFINERVKGKLNEDLFESTILDVRENQFSLDKLNGDKLKYSENIINLETEKEINVVMDKNIVQYELSSHEIPLEKKHETSSSSNFNPNFNDEKMERKINDEFFETIALDEYENGFSVEELKGDKFENSKNINYLGNKNEINAVVDENKKQYEPSLLSKDYSCFGNDEIQASEETNQDGVKLLPNKILKPKAKSVTDMRLMSVPTSSKFLASTNDNFLDYSHDKIQDVHVQNSKQTNLVAFVNEWMKSSIDTKVYKNSRNSLEINNQKQCRSDGKNTKNNLSNIKFNQSRKIRNVKKKKSNKVVKAKTIRSNTKKLNMQYPPNFPKNLNGALPLILKRPLRKRAKPKVLKVNGRKTTKKNLIQLETCKEKVNALSLNPPNSFDSAYFKKSRNLLTIIDTIKSNSLIQRKHEESFKRSSHKVSRTSSLSKRNKPVSDGPVNDRRRFENTAEPPEKIKFPSCNKVTTSNDQYTVPKQIKIVDDFKMANKKNSEILNHGIGDEMECACKKTVSQDSVTAPFAPLYTENFRFYRKSKETAFIKLKQINFH